MLKRLRWLATGAALGFGGSVWARKRLKEAAERYRPGGVAAASLNRVREALEEGRSAMRQREAELRGPGAKRRPPTP